MERHQQQSPDHDYICAAGNGRGRLNIALDASIVQTWINNPASNQGVLLVTPVAGKGPQMYSSESSTVSFRPQAHHRLYTSVAENPRNFL